jgi:hypothetical protein
VLAAGSFAHTAVGEVNPLRLHPRATSSASTNWLALVFLSFQFCRKIRNLLAHNLASLEFHRGPCGDGKTASRLVRIAPNAWFGEPHFENSEVSQLDGITLGKGVGNVIEGSLHHVEDLMLHEARLISDGYYEFPFR